MYGKSTRIQSVNYEFFSTGVLIAEKGQTARWTEVNTLLDQLPDEQFRYIASRSVEKVHLGDLKSLLRRHSYRIKRSIDSSLSLNLTANESLMITDSSTTLEGTEVLKAEETYKGIPVYDANLAIEVDINNGYFTGQASGYILNDIGNDLNNVEPEIDTDTVKQIMVERFSIQTFSSFQEKLYISKEPGEEAARLVYKVSLFYIDNGSPSRPTCFIDAKTAAIIRCYNTVETYRYKIRATGGNAKIGKLRYGTDWPLLDVKKKKKVCQYISNEVEVQDYKALEEPDNVEIVEFDCKKGISDSTNGGFSPSTDAYFFATMTVKMFKQWSNVQVCPLRPIKMDVHYGNNIGYAFFDGTEFKFSDGSPDRTYPYVTIGIVAHEITHCFTEWNSGLEYEGESGGIDEAFSDLAGEAVKFFVFGYNDWHTGRDVLKEGEYVRNMCDQSVDGISITHVDQYTDGLDVHFSSGVFNKVQCKLAQLSKWNIKSVFQVFTHANRFYWHPKSGYADAACGVLKAAYDLGHDINDVTKVFANVGVNICNINGHIRNVHPNTAIGNLKASLGQSIVFKLPLTGIDNAFQSTTNIKIKTSQGTGDVDLYVGKELTFEPSTILSNSTNHGNYEVIVLKDFNFILFDTLYIQLRPRMFSFSSVNLFVSVY